jgi:hypothetical protein
MKLCVLSDSRRCGFNPLNAELNPICHLLALLGGATIVVVSNLRVKYPFPIKRSCNILIYHRDQFFFPSPHLSIHVKIKVRLGPPSFEPRVVNSLIWSRGLCMEGWAFLKIKPAYFQGCCSEQCCRKWQSFGKTLPSSPSESKIQVQVTNLSHTVELHWSGLLLSGSPIIRIGLTLQVNLSRILQN